MTESVSGTFDAKAVAASSIVSTAHEPPRPRGSFPKSDWKTEYSSCTVLTSLPDTDSDHIETKGHTFMFGHCETIFSAHDNQSKTYPLLPEHDI